MEDGRMWSTPHLPQSDIIFDGLNSPQYLDFDNPSVPEATDSYFDCKADDPQTEPRNSKIVQKLPEDSEDDLIPPDEVISENENDPTPAKNNIDHNDQKESIDFGNDLIQAVRTLQVNQSSSADAELKPMHTSTPFYVKGVVPMPWRPNTKPEAKHCTKTIAFSFEERNKQMLQRKARRIQTILQAEKEARKFRANPVPKFLRKNISTKSLNAEMQGKKSTQTLQSLTQIPTFKAKSPKVLRKPPFQPNLPRQPLLPPEPFVLNSEIRAKEREQFDNFIKEKERLDEELRKLKEATQKRIEKVEIRKMRRQMVTKAQPIRQYKAVPITLKRALTEPSTPIMIKRQRR